jgi:superfamily II RNA helicase
MNGSGNLDFVDEGKSTVVVAPTSAGKTFIQYYCMEKVLEQADDGVLIYICPTKALCNQVFAGVQARFEKNYNGASRQVVGMFTRDERRNDRTCQILVTVPQCLDILLLSSINESQNW